MKGFLTACFVVVLFASCSKDNTNPSGNSGTFIKYKINGQQVQMNGEINSNTGEGEGSYGIRQSPTQANGLKSTLYAIQAQKGTKDLVSIAITADSLQLQSYNASDTSIAGLTYIKRDATGYFGGYRVADNLTVIITRHSEGSVDGKFSGTIVNVRTVNGSPVYTNGIVTEGEFKNVKMKYY